MSSDNSQYSSSRPWAVFYKQAKTDLEEINEGLLKNLETLDKENANLKEAIGEINNDLKEKEASLEESHKIITKLNEEYSKLIKEYKTLEQYNQDIESESQNNKKLMDDFTKSHQVFEKIQKQNEGLKNELEKFKKENQNIKATLQQKTAELAKKEKEFKDKEMIFNELKYKSENFVSMIKEREKLISDYDNKFQEMSSNLVQKENELKVMVNFSKELNNENKTNVEELTKQAVNTIKIFYNTLNNNSNESDGTSRIQLISGTGNTQKELEGVIKENKTSFLLEDAMNGAMYIPQGVNSISKEFLLSMNLKTELLKSELFASLLREFNFVKYIEGIIPRNDLKSVEEPGMNNNTDSGNENFIESLCARVLSLKSSYEDLERENQRLKKENATLLDNAKEFDLYVQKLKNDTKLLMSKLREKFDNVEKSYISQLAQTKENLSTTTAKMKNQIQKLQNEFKAATSELGRLKALNDHLSSTIDMMHKEKAELGSVEEANRNNLISKCGYFTIYGSSQAASRKDMMNMSFQLNDSFNEKSYKHKKEEINILKDEISRLKNEMTSLIETNAMNEMKLKERRFESYMLKMTGTCINIPSESMMKNNNLKNDLYEKESAQKIRMDMIDNNPECRSVKSSMKGDKTCNNCLQIAEKINDLKSNVKPNVFKDLKQFYGTYSMDIDKINNKIEEVVTKFTNTESQFANENQEKRIKVSQVREILSQVQKLISLLSIFIGKYNKDVYFYTTNLRKIFDFVAKLVYSNVFLSSVSSTASNKLLKNTIGGLQADNLMKLFYDMNGKVFASSELKKFYVIYENRTLADIIEIFRMSCEGIKSSMAEIRFDYETELSEIDESFLKHNARRNSEIVMNNSYKIVNEKIIKLKKFEFDFANMMELLKNYLVIQEIIVKNIFAVDELGADEKISNNPQMMSSEINKNVEKTKGDCLDRIFTILEDTMNYKIDEMDDDVIFSRKITLRLLKNQKTYLCMTFDF